LQGVRDEIYSNARKTIVFAFLLFLLISTASGLAVIFLVNPSVKRLQENAAKMARGEYVPEIRSTGTDEMAELSRSFDEMSRTVTERTTRLAQGRKMYKSLFEEVPCYLTTVNRQYVITRANRAFREQFGAQVGKNCFVGYKCRDSKCPVCPVEATFADGQSHQSEETWQLGGSDVYVVVNTAPIFDDEGNIAEVLEMSLDVTRLKQLQMELEKKKDEYKYLFGHAPCYLTVVDRNFEVVQANKLFRKDFGERIGEKCYRVYKGRDSQCPVCPVEATFADAQSHQSEEIWRRNGQETNIIVNTAPVTDDKGEVNAVIEMCTNVTEVKRLQSELALLGETIASLSHSTKNILSGLQGGVYVVDSGLERDKPERVRQGWGMVKRNVEKISHLVEGILYASKEREPEYKQCDPGELLSDLCDLYEEKARAHGVRLVREFEKTMGAGLLDPAGIHSALSNLVSNALEACLARGKGSRCIKVSGRIQDSTLEMEVTDDGIGIPEEVRDKLFGKFYSTKGSRGTGLGLLITKKVIEEHGGTIAVESEQGRGTSFLIHIPFQRMQQANGLGTAV
jgi:signal transduction histidine kinase/HAMP domain-containing protein